MKLDPKGVEAAAKAVRDCADVAYQEDAAEISEAAVLAYCKATDSVIVPVEPTTEMVNAGEMGLANAGVDDPNTEDAATCYVAMIQAAQEPDR